MWTRETLRDDPHQLAAAVAHYGSVSALSKASGIPRQTVQGWVARCSVPVPRPRPGERSRAASGSAVGVAEAVTAAAADGGTRTYELEAPRGVTAEDVLREHKIDPDDPDFEIAQLHVQHSQAVGKGGEPIDLQRIRVTLRARPKQIDPLSLIPASAAADLPPRKPRARRATQQPLTVAVCGDTHGTHQEPVLRDHWLAWCNDVKPSRVVHVGDLLNLSKPSRHRANLDQRHNDTPADELQAGRQWWLDTIAACGPDVQADQLCGNHDLRVQIACSQMLPECYDIRRPGEAHPWWDLDYLLGLTQMGVTLHRPAGEYHESTLQLAKGLGLTHGTKSGPQGGGPKHAQRHEGSQIMGHDHKQAITHVVRYRDGEPHQHVMVSPGMLARRNLGYAPDPDTQQGWATVTLHPCGLWNVDLARFDERRGVTFWRNRLYR